jgi:hypothetical protein
MVQHPIAVAERAPFDLVDGGRLPGGVHQSLDEIDGIVADADIAGEPVLPCAHQPAPECLSRAVRRWPMNENEIGKIELQLGKVMPRRLVGIAGLLDLRDQIDAVAGRAAAPDGLADSRLRAVVAGGIDQPISEIQGRSDRSRGVLRELPRP